MFQPPYNLLTKGRGGRWLIGQGGVWTYLEVVLWGDSNLCLSGYQKYSSVRISNTNQHQWHHPAETARPPPKQHKSEGVTITSQEKRK